MRRVLPVSVLLLACVAMPAAARPSTPSTEPAAPATIDPRVFVIGDSVLLGAYNSIALRLTVGGWHVSQYSAESLHVYESAGIVDAARAGGLVGEVFIVALGNNDGVSRAQFAGWIDDFMGHLRDVRRVYWVNIRQFAPWVPAANADIAAAARQWPNVRIIDWDRRATPDPSLVFADGLHLNPSGQAAMAELLGTTLDIYRAERTPLPASCAPRRHKPRHPCSILLEVLQSPF